MVLVDYSGGGTPNFIFVPKELEGKGWRRMAEVLREFTKVRECEF